MPPLETYGNYQLVEKLAVGGMAQLYLAKRLKPRGQERTVVLKRILPHLAEDTAFVTMFLDEARIAARLHHPNVIEILDLGAEGDSYFIAMEYIHGEDLRRISKRGIELGRRMPPPLVCRVVAQACRGLDYAHQRTDAAGKPLRIVHRDVSPQNILVGFDGQVKVVDFGIAKAADKATVTASGVIKGKHAYMSPEQALGRDIDHRTDVFALGIVLYETLTATRLFRRATDLQTLKAVSECRVEPPSRVFPGVPLPLDAIIMQALAKDLTVRYQRAEELAAALEGWLGDRPDGAIDAVGRYVSELFADRLEKEQREGKYMPTRSAIDIGSVSRSGANKTGPTASLRIDKKTVTDVNEAYAPPGGVAGSSPLESRSTDLTPAFVPPDRVTQPVPVAERKERPSKPALEQVADSPRRSSKPILEPVPDGGPRRPSKPVLEPVSDRDRSSAELPRPSLEEVPDFDGPELGDEPPTISAMERPQLGESGGTTPYGRPVSPVTGTAMYGKLNPLEQKTLLEPLARVATPIPPEPYEPPADRLVTDAGFGPPAEPVPPLDTAKMRPAARATMWPWWLAAGVTMIAVALVVAKVLIDRRALVAPQPVTTTAPPQPDASVAVNPEPVKPKEEAPPPEKPPEKPKMKPFNAMPVTGPTWALTRRGGQLFASLSGATLEVGAPLRIVGPAKGGTKERDFYGVASAVEVKEGEARVLFEDPEGLPDGLFVTTEEDKLAAPYVKPAPARGGGQALVGSVQLRASEPAADVALKNATDFDWTGCEVRLPDNRALKLGGSVVVKAGGTQWITGSAFKPRSGPADAKQHDGFALVRCAEGDGWLKAALLP